MVHNDIELLINDPKLAPKLRSIAQSVSDGKRITYDEGVYLFEHAELGYLGTLANFVR